MKKMKFRSKVELNYNQMRELLESVLKIQFTKDCELNVPFILHGDYGTYTYQINKNCNVLVLKVKEI